MRLLHGYVVRIKYCQYKVLIDFNTFDPAHRFFIIFGAGYLTELGSTSIANQYTTVLNSVNSMLYSSYWTVSCFKKLSLVLVMAKSLSVSNDGFDESDNMFALTCLKVA